MKFLMFILTLMSVAAFAAPVRQEFPNPSLNESVRIIPEKYNGFGADLIFYPNSTWSISWEDLNRKSQNITDDDFNDWQGMVEFKDDVATMWRTYDGAGYILTLNVGQPILTTYNDSDILKTFSTSMLTSGDVISLALHTNVGTVWYSGNTNNGIGDANQFNADHRVHAIISCVSGNCTGDNPNPVPEPMTYGMIGVGLMSLIFVKKIRK